MAGNIHRVGRDWITDSSDETTLIECQVCGWRTLHTSRSAARSAARAHKHHGQKTYG